MLVYTHFMLEICYEFNLTVPNVIIKMIMCVGGKSNKKKKEKDLTCVVGYL